MMRTMRWISWRCPDPHATPRPDDGGGAQFGALSTWRNRPIPLTLARAEVPECFRDGVIAEPSLIKLPRPIKGKKGVGHNICQGIEIGIGKCSLALQGFAGPLVSRANKRKTARSKPFAIAKNSRQKTSLSQ